MIDINAYNSKNSIYIRNMIYFKKTYNKMLSLLNVIL